MASRHAPKVYRDQGGNRMVIGDGGTLVIAAGGSIDNEGDLFTAFDVDDSTLQVVTDTMSIKDAGVTPTQLAAKSARRTAKSQVFDLDNGSGVTIDDVIIRPSTAITITAARVVYVDATTGTVASALVRVGTTVNGEQIVASTAYENTKAIGTITALSIVSGAVAANTPVCVRHTGIAATAAGKAYVEIEFQVDP